MKAGTKVDFQKNLTIYKSGENESEIYDELSQNNYMHLEDYTSTFWQRKTWTVPDSLYNYQPSESDAHVKRYYETLQHTLYETGLPETIDMTREDKKVTHDQVTIGILSSSVKCMSILLSGGEQCPGDILLILSLNWCRKLPSPSLENKYSLYVHQAVTFHKGGYSFLERYSPPRRVTYFVNFFTNACTGGVCYEGEQLERGLDCPMSSSLKLNQFVDDKLYTRVLLGKANVCYPITLAFHYKPVEIYENEGLDITIIPVYVDLSDPTSKNLVRNEINKFITKNKDASFNKLVVRPSSALWNGSKSASFYDKMDIEAITTAVENILSHLEEGFSVLVEEYIPFKQPQPQQQDANKMYNIRIRSTVCRTSSGVPQTTNIACSIANVDQPVNDDNSVPQSLELSLKKYGFPDVQIKEIRKDIELQSEKALASIIKKEKEFNEEKRGEVGSQTDVIGIDMILKKQAEKYEVVVIEVKSHYCMINCQVYEFINPNTLHEATIELVHTMITRSNTFLITGRTLLIIGAGRYGKWFVFEEASRLGIKVVLVDSDFDDSMPKVSVFIQHDSTNLKNIEQISEEIIKKVNSKNINLDGCISFCEFQAPLAAAICNKLKLVGCNFRAAMIAKNKFLTHQILSKRQGDIPHFPRTHLYSCKTRLISSRDDIHKAVIEDSSIFPGVLKLLYGAGAVGVHLVENKNECLEYFDKLHKDSLVVEIGCYYGSPVMLTDYIVGSEHDVDLIIFNRRLIAAFVSDNGPTRVPNFFETVAVMPSILDEESKNQLITAAYQCCLEIGLENGTFNVELKMTNFGPKLLEINARMGGFYLRDWIKQCYDVDILLCTFLIALGVRPHVRPKVASKSIVGVICLPSEHLDLFSDKDKIKQLQEKHEKGSIRFNIFKKETFWGKFEEPFANIAAVGPDTRAAKTALIDLCNKFQISTPTYNVENMLSFIRS